MAGKGVKKWRRGEDKKMDRSDYPTGKAHSVHFKGSM